MVRSPRPWVEVVGERRLLALLALGFGEAVGRSPGIGESRGRPLGRRGRPEAGTEARDGPVEAAQSVLEARGWRKGRPPFDLELEAVVRFPGRSPQGHGGQRGTREVD